MVVAIVQARMNSSRFPGKVLQPVLGKPAIWHLMNRLAHTESIDRAILAVPDGPEDDILADYATSQSWGCYRGSEEDVLDRYYQAAVWAGGKTGDAIVRVTGDDILLDPKLIDAVVRAFLACRPEVHFACNNAVPRFPYGTDVEVFSFEALETAWQEAKQPMEREHVGPFIRNRPQRFPAVELRLSRDHSDVHFSIDYPEDLEFNRKIYAQLYREGEIFSYQDVLNCIREERVVHKRAAHQVKPLADGNGASGVKRIPARSISN